MVVWGALGKQYHLVGRYRARDLQTTVCGARDIFCSWDHLRGCTHTTEKKNICPHVVVDKMALFSHSTDKLFNLDIFVVTWHGHGMLCVYKQTRNLSISFRFLNAALYCLHISKKKEKIFRFHQEYFYIIGIYLKESRA